MKSTGERFKFIREREGKTQKEIAEILGMKVFQILKIEGNTQKISDELAMKLNELYGVSFQWLKIGKGEVYDLQESPEQQFERLGKLYDIEPAQLKKFLGVLIDHKNIEYLQLFMDANKGDKDALLRLHQIITQMSLNN